MFSVEHQPISILPTLYDIDLIFSPEFAVNLVWVSYAYAGWNSSIYVVGEIEQPEKNIFRSIFIGTFIVALLYILLNFVFLYTSPIDQLIGKVEVGYFAGVNLFGNKYAAIISLCIGLLLISTVSSYVYIGPRIIQAIGLDHHRLKIFSKTDSNNIPLNAFILQFIISMVFVITSTFEQVLLYTGIILIITSTITVISLFYLRYREPDLIRPYLAWGYPWTPLLFIILNSWVLYYTFKLQTFESVVGLSLMPTIDGSSDGPRDYMYFAYKDLMRSVYFEDYKLIEYNVYGNRRTQLFNIKSDPVETLNLAHKDEFELVLKRLRDKMIEGKTEYSDNLPPFNRFWDGVNFE